MKITPAGFNSADIRKWAILNGFPQLEGKNGRLPGDAIDAYVRAHAADVGVPPAEVQ